jgi:NAD(P)-dependent dehydrogenase (short-subunit alcohol dehydrogenase family)
MISNNDRTKDALQWIAAGAGLFLAATAVYNELTKFKLAGKVVLVTGGSRGLGLELSRQLARKGARLVICARTAHQLENARVELARMGADVLALQADLTDRDDVKTVIDDVIRHFGRLDVLINNAGIVQVGPYDSMELKDYEEAMDTNFWASLYTMHHALPHFMRQGGGRIVNVTSIGGKIAVPHLLPYTASKFALVGLSEGMHAELKKQNIHVTTVVPNLMRTGSPRNITVKGDHQKEYAWFKHSDSNPLLSQSVEVAARNIIRALEYGESEAVLSFTAKLATLVQGVAPKWVSALLSVTNRFLPDNVQGGDKALKGFEAESERSRGPISGITDRAAVRNNED